MLSMQIDRLRSCADLYDGTTKPEMAKELQRPHLAQELRDAADAIWQLRDDLQRANTENAKLREEVHHLKKGDVLHVLTDQELADQQKHEREMQTSIKALDDENAKLRELVRDIYDELNAATQYDAGGGRGVVYELANRMRELGIEVDND